MTTLMNSWVRGAILVALSWATLASLLIVVPQPASAGPTTDGWVAEYDAVFAPARGEALSAPRSRTLPITGASPFGGVSGPAATRAALGAQLIDLDACDGNDDGIFGGTAEEDQSHGTDHIATLWQEDRPGGPRLPVTEPGYRVNVYVCEELVDGESEYWIYPREPLKPGSVTEPRITLVEDADLMQNDAKKEVLQTLETNFYKPGWEIWPGYNSRQIVGLPTWLYVTDESWEYRPSASVQRPQEQSSGTFDPVNRTYDGGEHAYDDIDGVTFIDYFDDEVSVKGISEPVGSVWKFSDLDEPIICVGRGNQWEPGKTEENFPEPENFCHRDWEHTFEFDDLELEVALQYVVRWESSLSGDTSMIDAFADGDVAASPAEDNWRALANADLDLGATSGQQEYEGPFNDAQDLRVGEVQAYGSSIGAQTQTTPPPSPAILGQLHEPCGGFWGTVGCAFKTAIQIYDAVASVIIPGYEQIKRFLEGCAEGAAAFLQEFKDTVLATIKAVSNPIAAASEAWEGIQTMIGALSSDPDGFIASMLDELAMGDTRRTEGVAKWAGKMVCKYGLDFIVGYITGTITSKIGKKILDFIGKARGKRVDLDVDVPRDRNGNDDGGPDGDRRDDNENRDDEERRDRDSCPTPNSSFPAGTPVLMADGTHSPIELVRPGDHVISFNFDTGVWEPKFVLDQWSHPDRGPPATATLTDGSTITATDDHLFWVESTHTWTQLRDVQTGDLLLTPDGTVTIDHITVGPAHPWTVWELTVTDNHNFTVAADTSDVLVHNAPDPCDLTPDELADLRNRWRDLSADEMWLLYRATVGRGSRTNDDFADLHEEGWRWDPDGNQWKKPGGSALAQTLRTLATVGLRRTVKDNADRHGGNETVDEPLGTPNEIGEAGESLTEQALDRMGRTITGGQERLRVTLEVDGQPLTFDVVPDFITVDRLDNGDLSLRVVESKATAGGSIPDLTPNQTAFYDAIQNGSLGPGDIDFSNASPDLQRLINGTVDSGDAWTFDGVDLFEWDLESAP